jgi:hypothetical protein
MRTTLVALALTVASCCGAPANKPSGNSTGTTAPTTTTAAAAEPPASVELKTLLKDYQDNEVRADSLYKNKVFSFSGKIGDIGVSLGSPFLKIGLTGDQFEHPVVQCMFSKGSNEKLAAMSKGSMVKVRGKVSGLMMLNVVVRDCDTVP